MTVRDIVVTFLLEELGVVRMIANGTVLDRSNGYELQRLCKNSKRCSWFKETFVRNDNDLVRDRYRRYKGDHLWV